MSKKNNKEGICYIFGAGKGIKPVQGCIQNEDYIIAADGGLQRVLEQNLRCDLLLGDFDSINAPIPSHYNVQKLNPIKDETDVWVAVKHALRLGYRRFEIFGGTGGRASHTMANYQTLLMIAQHGGVGILHGEEEDAGVFCPATIHFTQHASGYFSIFPLGDKITGVTLQGFKYSLEKAEIQNHFPLGVSNEFCGRISTVSFQTGAALIFVSMGNFEHMMFELTGN